MQAKRKQQLKKKHTNERGKRKRPCKTTTKQTKKYYVDNAELH